MSMTALTAFRWKDAVNQLAMLGTSSAIYLLVKPAGTRPSTTTDEVRHYRRH
jgi:hypothetical protein